MSSTPPPQPPCPPTGPSTAPPRRADPTLRAGGRLEAESRSGRSPILAVLGILSGVLAASGGDEASAEEITLEPVSSTGDNPFGTERRHRRDRRDTASEQRRLLLGEPRGLYGGTLNVASCDAQKLVTFLSRTSTGRASASVVGITFEQIPGTCRPDACHPPIRHLRPEPRLHERRREPDPGRSSQAVRAVLVDKYGVP